MRNLALGEAEQLYVRSLAVAGAARIPALGYPIPKAILIS